MSTDAKGEGWIVKTVPGYADSTCIVDGSGKIIDRMHRDPLYYTDWCPTPSGDGVILCEKRAAAAGRHVATPEIRAKIMETERANARLIAAAPDMDLLLRCIGLGVARVTPETHEIAFGGIRVAFAAYTGDWSRVVELLGRDRLRAALALATEGAKA